MSEHKGVGHPCRDDRTGCRSPDMSVPDGAGREPGEGHDRDCRERAKRDCAATEFRPEQAAASRQNDDDGDRHEADQDRGQYGDPHTSRRHPPRPVGEETRGQDGDAGIERQHVVRQLGRDRFEHEPRRNDPGQEEGDLRVSAPPPRQRQRERHEGRHRPGDQPK